MFKIGNVEINGKVVCGPMAGVTNKVFRKLVKKNGAALTYTEMTSNVGLKYNSEKTLAYADIDKNESPVALQIFGGSVQDYIDAAKYYDKNSNADIIDINMGCPVNKVAIKSEAGSALLKTPEKIRQIIRGITSSISKPLTIKIRIGWDENDLTYLKIAKIAEEEGAAAIAIHGRTRKQMYSGKANWEAIKEIKNHINIPVIGNGDITNEQDAKKMLDYTNVDAIMISRKAMTYPWIFDQINSYLNSETIKPQHSLEFIINELQIFYKDLIILKGDRIAFKEIKGIANNWLTSFSNIKQKRVNLIQSQTNLDFLNILKDIKINASI